ncbi:unnamed protein product [Urochloa decumbens]|uniref:Uncharacterized protein n=1 Tax=Urochloa decumbens TaxID=240449 RepID=A0ABC9G959_9POAL
MASRFLLHLRAGASAAARSARTRHLPAGGTWAPAMAPTTGALADTRSFAGRIPTLQGVRQYGTPSNYSITELNRAMRKVERRLDALEGKVDIGHKPLVQQVLKNHEKDREFHRFANAVMVIGFGITGSVIMYYRFPWMSAEPRPSV